MVEIIGDEKTQRKAAIDMFVFCYPAMIIKHLWPTTTVEHVLKALDPFAYLDERNVRLMKRKPGVGTKCLCFVDMDSHQVKYQQYFLEPNCGCVWCCSIT